MKKSRDDSRLSRLTACATFTPATRRSEDLAYHIQVEEGIEDGVRFTCQPGCIACCDQDGYVYLTEDDLLRAAKFTGMSADRFELKYVYRTTHQLRFRKPRDKQCPFLITKGDSRGCSIHPAKPTQCRTFPYWPELVGDRDEWKRTAKFCPGIGKGELIQIGTAMEMAEEQRAAYPDMYKWQTHR